jgi:hypothetical protein
LKATIRHVVASSALTVNCRELIAHFELLSISLIVTKPVPEPPAVCIETVIDPLVEKAVSGLVMLKTGWEVMANLKRTDPANALLNWSFPSLVAITEQVVARLATTASL